MLSTDSTAKPFYRAPLNRQSWSTTTPNICRAVEVCRALRVEAPRHTPDLCRALRLNLHGTIQTFSVCFFQTTRHTLNLCRAFFPDCTAHSEPLPCASSGSHGTSLLPRTQTQPQLHPFDVCFSAQYTAKEPNCHPPMPDCTGLGHVAPLPCVSSRHRSLP